MDLDALLREQRRRKGFLAAAHDKQRAAIEDPGTLKAILTPRRAGKTTTCVIDAFHDAMTHPGALYTYIALTRPSAEQIAWPIIRQVDRDFGVGCHYQEAKLRVTFPNDAQLKLVGADQKEWTERLRGQKMRRCYIDEASFYRINLAKLVEEVILPTLIDERGTLYLIGTPGDIAEGMFYDVTTGKVPGWNVHKWSTADNPHVKDQYLAEIARRRSLGVDVDKDPGTRREFFGEWVEDERGLVYLKPRVIDEYKPDWSTDHPVLAVDFGYKEDATSFTLSLYSDRHPDYVILESWSRNKMLIPDIAEQIRLYEEQNPGIVIIGDPSSAQIIEELRQRFDIAIYDAQKTDKYHWIKLYNGDAAVGRVVAVAGSCQDLLEEQKKLQKHVSYSGQWKEWPGQKNDCCDSNLYAFRHSYHFRYSEPEHVPAPGSTEAIERELVEYWSDESDDFEKRRGLNGFLQ